MALPRVTLQALEAFACVARHRSMQVAAREMRMSISSISHHVARLEAELGAPLLDRSRRPMGLTRAGQDALHHVVEALRHMRLAASQTAIGDLHRARVLRIGIVEDFESRISPELAVALAGHMPQAKLTIRTVLSHEAPGLLLGRDIDIAIVTEIDDPAEGLTREALLRDPFVLAAPPDLPDGPAHLLAGSALPFLRFNADHAIGRQVEAHLARNRIRLPNRYEFDSAQSIMAVIARGGGWSILTPLNFLRAQRFMAQVRLHPLPFAGFARRLVVLSGAELGRPIPLAIAEILRGMIQREAIAPIVANYPWLADGFSTLDDAPRNVE